MGTPEIGFVSMSEIRDLRGPLGLPVERDLHFDATKTLSAYADEAQPGTEAIFRDTHLVS
jgi:hypothetical protein